MRNTIARKIVRKIMLLIILCVCGTFLLSGCENARSIKDENKVASGTEIHSPKEDENVEKETNDNELIMEASAYSRLSNGDVIDWSDCGYTILNNDEMEYMSEYGLFASRTKNAIVYKDETTGEIQVSVSDDAGNTWRETTIDRKDDISWCCIGFTTDSNGWIVICSFVGMGNEQHELYSTKDGGASWTQIASNIDDIYGRVLSGCGFVDENVGFLCFRYEDEKFSPAVCMTEDGGETWEKINISVPKEYEGQKATALSPAWHDKEFVLPVMLEKDGQQEIVEFVKNGKNFELKNNA